MYSPAALCAWAMCPMSWGQAVCGARASLSEERGVRKLHFIDFVLPFSSFILFLSYLVSSFCCWHPLISGLTGGWDKFPSTLPSLAPVSVTSLWLLLWAHTSFAGCVTHPPNGWARPVGFSWRHMAFQNLKPKTLSFSALSLNGILATLMRSTTLTAQKK